MTQKTIFWILIVINYFINYFQCLEAFDFTVESVQYFWIQNLPSSSYTNIYLYLMTYNNGDMKQ